VLFLTQPLAAIPRARSITMEQIYPGKEAWPVERC